MRRAHGAWLQLGRLPGLGRGRQLFWGKALKWQEGFDLGAGPALDNEQCAAEPWPGKEKRAACSALLQQAGPGPANKNVQVSSAVSFPRGCGHIPAFSFCSWRVLPEPDGAVVARRGKQPPLRGVPPHAVDVSGVRLLAPAGQAEGGQLPHEQLPHAPAPLLAAARRHLAEHADAVVGACGGDEVVL